MQKDELHSHQDNVNTEWNKVGSSVNEDAYEDSRKWR